MNDAMKAANLKEKKSRRDTRRDISSEVSSDIRGDIVGGVTTFFTMAYIVIVNPSILATEGTGLQFSGVLTATVLICFLMTLLMGLYAKLPFAVAPGMGINAFFTFTLILGRQIPWPIALGMVFWAGAIFLLISVTPVREKIAQCLPQSLRVAAAVGIGLFLTLIGLKNAGLVVADPVTFVRLGSLNTGALIALVGFFIMVILLQRKITAAFLIGILVSTLLAGAFDKIKTPDMIFQWPDFSSVFLKLDIVGALQPAFLSAIFAVMMTDLFDSISTFVGVSQSTGLVTQNGEPRNLRQGLIVDAWATLTAGLFGTSSGTAYIESAAGIEAGGKSGFSAVVTAFCFLPCFFIAPLVSLIPDFATAPVLILVGAMMFKSVTKISIDKWEEFVPVFLTIVLIPLTFSITQGILWGIISYVALHILVGRRKELSPYLIGIAILSCVLIWLEQ